MNQVVNNSGFEPTGDLVLVLPPKVEAKTSSGIVIAQQTVDKEQISCRIGVVIAMGEQAPAHPRMNGIGVGDKVLFPRYVQDRWVVGGDMYYIMRAESVHGKVTKMPDSEFNAAIRANEGPFAINT
jgi:co-chaperonin GroES (HSP10)